MLEKVTEHWPWRQDGQNELSGAAAGSEEREEIQAEMTEPASNQVIDSPVGY